MTAASVGPRLVVEDLCVRLAPTGPVIIDEVSFVVATGQVLGLVGESGSGKTTVALAMLAYARRGLRIVSGRVLLDGKDMLKAGPSELRTLRGAKVAYVPQDPASALNPALRVSTQLKEVLSAHGVRSSEIPSRLAEVLQAARLDSSEGIIERYPHQLSGGQQQRLLLAMAFCCRPMLIIADEPTTGLDVSTQAHVLDTLRSMCGAYGVAAVYVSHDLAIVSTLADSVVVMYAGRIVEAGPTRAVFTAPAHPYTARLLSAVPSPERSEGLIGIEGVPPRPGARPPGCGFAPRCTLAKPACEAAPPAVVDLGERRVRCIRLSEAAIEVRTPPEPTRLQERLDTNHPLLEVSHLSASYGATPVLFDVALSVPAEGCIAVVGESGSGKTTLARCIAGLHASWNGQVHLDGTLLAKGSRGRAKESLRRVQYIFQNPYTSLNPRKTIGQIVGQPLSHFFDLSPSEGIARVRNALSEVSLGPDVSSRYPDQLSGGERQRVAIARALVVEPDLLVCDEVTSALDVSVQAVIIELLRRLQSERHLSLVFITHNVALVRSIATAVVVLSAGRIVESGSVVDILERPKDAYTIALMADVPRLEFRRIRTSRS